MKEALLSAIRDGGPWLSRFTRTGYADAFSEYVARYGDLFREAVRATDGNPSTLADALLDGMSDGWKREKLWRRGARRFDDKQMTVRYLSPMLLEIGEEDFARCLREAWARRWPKDGYQLASWRKLASGFRLTIMGIDMERRREDDET